MENQVKILLKKNLWKKVLPEKLILMLLMMIMIKENYNKMIH